VRVAIGQFARSSIESHLGNDLAAAVGVALLHYARRARSKRPPPGVPAFSRDQAGRDPGFEVELEVASDVQTLLEEEARRQKMAVDQIVAHAVFVYLADLESPSGETPDTNSVPDGGNHPSATLRR
jgi:hypothetical protein